MIPEKIKKILKKQHYEIVGKHSAVQICRWTKNSLKNQGVCYKEKFYGIKSHLCCQMTPAVMWCPNKCVHCWRAIELTLGSELPAEGIDNPKEIINDSIKAQRKLLQGFKIDKHSKKKQLSKANQKKYLEAQEPMQFAISLSGEPTVYKHLGRLIQELRDRGKTSFLVTNGLYPEKLKELERKKQLPTQLYVSVNTSNKELYRKFHRSALENAWERLNESIDLLGKLKGKTRTVFRMNLVKDLNMKPEHAKEFAEMIKKSDPQFVELKGFMSVGFARQRLGYNRMPNNKEMKDFIKLILKELQETEYKLLGEHERSRAYVLGKDESELKIKKSEY
jgi:tRNA wybutosine-synthesizing protein 1